MTILNATTDSFCEANRSTNVEAIVAMALQAEKEGADILDIGAESTQPQKRTPVPEEIEKKRIVDVVKQLRPQTQLPLSIDTIKPAVARAALEAGANWINDISGFYQEEMRQVAAEADCPIVVMHLTSPPFTSAPPAPNSFKGVESILEFFSKRVELLLAAGIQESRIILDPGFGGGWFGKTVDDNLTILQNLHKIKELGFPLLAGISRKTFIRETFHCSVEEALPGTLALSTLLIQKEVDILRVHDTQPHRDLLHVLSRLEQQPAPKRDSETLLAS